MVAKSTFSINLRNIRKKKRISQEALAELIDSSHHVVSNLERGITSPNLEMIELLCEVFDVPITDLVIDQEELGADKLNILRQEAIKLSDENLQNIIEIVLVLAKNQNK